MNTISRPLLAAAGFASGIIVGLIGSGIGTAKRPTHAESDASRGNRSSLGASTSPNSKESSADLILLSDQLMQDDALSEGPNQLLLDFVTKSASMNSAELLSLLEHFEKADKEAEKADSKISDGSMVGKAFLILRLTTVDSKAAATWLLKQNFLEDRSKYDQAWKLIATRSPEVLDAIIAETTDPLVKNELTALACQRYVNSDPLRVLKSVNEAVATDPAMASAYEELLPEAVSNFARQQPLAAARMCLEMDLSGKFDTHNIRSVMETWSKGDPDAALKWALSLKGDAAVRAVEALVSGYTHPGTISAIAEAMKEWTDVKEAHPPAEAVGGEPSAHLTKLMSDVVESIFDSRGPEFIQAWAEQLQNTQMKSTALASLTSKWIERDPVAASTYIAALQDSPLKNSGIEAMVSSIVSSDPERAFAWSRRLTDPTLQSQLMLDTMRAWLETDPITAVKTLEQMPPAFRESFSELPSKNSPPAARPGTISN